MTAKVYTHLMRERFDEGRERLEKYMADKRRGQRCDVRGGDARAAT